MLLLTQGEVGMETCQPLVESLKLEQLIEKIGPQIVTYDLLSFSLKDGNSVDR